MSDVNCKYQRLKFTPHSIPFWQLITLLLLSLDWFGNHPCFALRDDWYSYESFEDVSKWSETYYQLCSRSNFDLYREPRTITESEDLRAMNEALTPLKIEDDTVVEAPENVTLHIYNNAGIRKAYSLSYGFQRNKECLHGQDADCVVFPGFGRVRALVLSAERYKENENLNFIKDHFQIEEPERFVTILNGGSEFERKFYEAIFLGGLKVTDPRRSSHQINGVSYPLEIYMYFVDETVPSLTLSTVLVVLVEESDRDNINVKPLVATVEKLYDQERRFLETNKLMVRRERLFHHLGKSTQFDIHDVQGVYEENQQVIQESLDASAVHEPSFSAYIEAFEKMQSLEAILFFVDEDVEHVKDAYQHNSGNVIKFENREGNRFFPCNGKGANNNDSLATHDLHVMAYSAIVWPLRSDKLPKDVQDCKSAVDWMMDNDLFGYHNVTFKNTSLSYIDWRGNTNVPTVNQTTKFLFWKRTATYLCDYLEVVMENFRLNQNVTFMKNLPYFGRRDEANNPIPGKYDLMKQDVDIRNKTSLYNQLVLFYLINAYGKSDLATWPWYYANQITEIATNMVEYLVQLQKANDYAKVKDELDDKIKREVEHLHFPDERTMREVIQYLKYGDKGNTAVYRRSELHEQFATNFLPSQNKRRGFIELGNMEMAPDEIDDDDTVSPMKALVDQAFQISWLIPHDGGYYYYEGSSPVPPCFRVENMIVFKKPIKMSKLQIDMLTRLPVSFNRKRDITSTTPIINDPFFVADLRSEFSTYQKFEEVSVNVYYQKRNQLFLGHDGVHKNAVEEYDKIKARSEASPSLIIMRGFGGADMLMSLVLAVGLRVMVLLGYV